MTKKKKGNPKYIITNLTKDEVILNDLTQKASLEWLLEKYEELTDEGHIEFASKVYKGKLKEHGFHITTIKAINKVAVVDRFKKLIKGDLLFNDELFKIEVQE